MTTTSILRRCDVVPCLIARGTERMRERRAAVCQAAAPGPGRLDDVAQPGTRRCAGRAASTEALPENWWAAFEDPILDQLQTLAVAVSPDLQTAALHFAQARVQRQTVSAQRGPQANVTGAATASVRASSAPGSA